MSESINRIMRRPDVEARTGLSRSSIYEGMAAGWFPRPIQLSPKSVGWLEREIDAWLDRRIADRDRKIAQ